MGRWRVGSTRRWAAKPVPPGHVWIVPEGVEHEVEWGRHAEVLKFYLEIDWVHRLTGERVRALSLEPLERYTRSVPAIGELGGLIRGQCRTPGAPNDRIVAGLALAFTSQLMVAHFAPRQAATRPNGLVLSRLVLADIRAQVEEHLDQKLTLALLAKRAGLSPSYFGQMFRAAMGMSPLAYIIDRRLLRARAMLRTGKFTVKEVAHAVGFSDQHQMDYHFARNLGNPPSCYLPNAWPREIPTES